MLSRPRAARVSPSHSAWAWESQCWRTVEKEWFADPLVPPDGAGRGCVGGSRGGLLAAGGVKTVGSVGFSHPGLPATCIVVYIARACAHPR